MKNLVLLSSALSLLLLSGCGSSSHKNTLATLSTDEGETVIVNTPGTLASKDIQDKNQTDEKT